MASLLCGRRHKRRARGAPRRRLLAGYGHSHIESVEARRRVAPDARQELPESFADGTLVMCQLDTVTTRAPTARGCPRVRGRRTAAPERFGVMVRNQRQGQAKFSVVARDRSFLGSLDNSDGIPWSGSSAM